MTVVRGRPRRTALDFYWKGGGPWPGYEQLLAGFLAAPVTVAVGGSLVGDR